MLRSITVHPETALLLDLGSSVNSDGAKSVDRTPLNCWGDSSLTAVYLWYFPAESDRDKTALVQGSARPLKEAWKYFWTPFSVRTTEHSRIEGWSTEATEHARKIAEVFYGQLVVRSAENSREYWESVDGMDGIYGGTMELRRMASLGFELHYVHFICLDHGWLGSVNKTSPDVYYPNGICGLFGPREPDPVP